MLPNNTFWDANFEWIFFVLASENQGKIEQFAYFYRKQTFCNNHCFSLGEITIFLVLSLEKSTKIGCSNAMKNNIKKKNFKNRIWEAIWASKILENRSQKRCKAKLVSQRYGTGAQVVAN